MLGLNAIDGDYIPSNLDNDCFEVNTNWKHALISNLYSTVEFLKSEIKENNILITMLINAQVCGNGIRYSVTRSRANSSNSDVSEVTIILPSSRSVTVSQQDIDSVITLVMT